MLLLSITILLRFYALGEIDSFRMSLRFWRWCLECLAYRYAAGTTIVNAPAIKPRGTKSSIEYW